MQVCPMFIESAEHLHELQILTPMNFEQVLSTVHVSSCGSFGESKSELEQMFYSGTKIKLGTAVNKSYRAQARV